MHENRETSSLAAPSWGSPAGEGGSRTSGAHGGEESDRAVVPMNSPNNAEEEPSEAAEAGEGRARTKENIVEAHTPPTQSGERVSQGLDGVRQAAKESIRILRSVLTPSIRGRSRMR
jgi:RNA-directed DNA polymerase